MRLPRLQLLAAAVGAVTLTALTMTQASAASPTVAKASPFVHVCAAPTATMATCDILVNTAVPAISEAALRDGKAATPSGLGAADFQSAYKVPSSTAGSGETVAVVEAFNDKTVVSDAATYRSQYGLPACTTASGCFKVVGQTGGTPTTRTNADWAEEESLDVDMVSAICPKCTILVVEANGQSIADMGAAENTAAKLGADVISNSWQYSESTASAANDTKYFTHPGIPLLASSGDSGYGTGWPATSNKVIAVGGTSLKKSSAARGWTETAWSGAGSGCSKYETILPAQSSLATGCTTRADADVSADADPNTGAAIYDSGAGGWQVVGGTSESSPIVASVIALAGNSTTVTNNGLYANEASMFDITSGSNGTCSTHKLCNAGAGWDGPTGLGTPDGIGAF